MKNYISIGADWGYDHGWISFKKIKEALEFIQKQPLHEFYGAVLYVGGREVKYGWFYLTSHKILKV